MSRPATGVQAALAIGGAIVGGFAVGRAAAVYRREGPLPKQPVEGVAATLFVFSTSCAALALTGAALFKAVEEYGVPALAGVMAGASGLAVVAASIPKRSR